MPQLGMLGNIVYSVHLGEMGSNRPTVCSAFVKNTAELLHGLTMLLSKLKTSELIIFKVPVSQEYVLCPGMRVTSAAPRTCYVVGNVMPPLTLFL